MTRLQRKHRSLGAEDEVDDDIGERLGHGGDENDSLYKAGLQPAISSESDYPGIAMLSLGWYEFPLWGKDRPIRFTRFSGSVVQWFSGSVVQWFSGSVVQWLSGSPESDSAVPAFYGSAGKRKFELLPLWTSARLVRLTLNEARSALEQCASGGLERIEERMRGKDDFVHKNTMQFPDTLVK